MCMNTVVPIRTQISGPTHGNRALFLVKHRLREANVRVAAPVTKDFIMFNGRNYTFNPQRWSRYEFATYYFSAIRRSDFHTVCNETSSQPGLIDQESALSIAAAMLYGRPIVLTAQPVFDKKLDYFMRETIAKRLDKMTIDDLAIKPAVEVAAVAASLPKQIDYSLSLHERVLIRAQLKLHFRELLRPPKRMMAYKLTKVSFA